MARFTGTRLMTTRIAPEPVPFRPPSRNPEKGASQTSEQVRRSARHRSRYPRTEKRGAIRYTPQTHLVFHARILIPAHFPQMARANQIVPSIAVLPRPLSPAPFAAGAAPSEVMQCSRNRHPTTKS